MPRKARRGGVSASGAVSGAIDSLSRCRADLLSQRAALDGQIAAIENAIRAIGAPLPVGAGVRRGRGRPPGPARAPGAAGVRRGPGRPRGPSGKPPRPGSLKDRILKVMQGRGTMAVREITDAVLKSGFKTENRTLAKSIGIALAEMKNWVEKVDRGQFRLK